MNHRGLGHCCDTVTVLVLLERGPDTFAVLHCVRLACKSEVLCMASWA